MKIDQEHYWLLGLAAAGAFLRWWYLWDYSSDLQFDLAIGADVMEYHGRALELINGKFFPDDPDIHAPLYSWFLALVYWITNVSIPAARIIQTVINYGAWFLGYRVLKVELGIPLVTRMVFFVFGMLSSVLYFHQAELISETLLIPLLMVEFYLICHFRNRWQLLFGGMIGGLMILTHGLMTPFVGLVSLSMLFRRKWWSGLFFIVGLIVVVAPFVIAKSHHYGGIKGVQENAAFNFYLGNNRYSDGGCYMRPGLWWRQTHSKARFEANRRDISVDQWWLEQAEHFWVDHPWKALKITAKKALMVWSPRELIAGADPDVLVYRSTVVFILRAMLPMAFLLAAIGVISLIRHWSYRYWFFCLLIFSLWIAQVFTVTSGRYRLSMMPGVFLLASIGFSYVNWRRVWLVLPAAWLFFGALSLGSGRPEEGASIIGEAAFIKGKDDLAYSLLSFAERYMRDPSRFDNLLGILAERKGNYVEAEKRYRKAIKIEPWKHEGWMNLGNLLSLNPDRLKEAYDAFQQALKFGSSNAAVNFNYARFLDRNNKDPLPYLTKALKLDKRMDGAWNMLGVLYMKQGNPQKAYHAFSQAVKFNSKETGYIHNLKIAENILKKERTIP